MSIATRQLLVISKALLWSSLVFFCFVGSCEKRDLFEPTLGMELTERYWIRVLLFNNIIECSLSSDSGFTALCSDNGRAIDFAYPDSFLVKIADGNIQMAGNILGSDVTIKPKVPHTFSINSMRFRGNLRLVVREDKASFDAVNNLPLESYLAGVVGAEMPAYWEQDALMAQTIAARTYSLFIKNKFGANRHWDVKRTQAHQVYKGLAAEYPTVWEAVRKTTGQVLTCSDGNGSEKVFPTYYSSTCGGHTEDSTNVFGDSLAPLNGVICPYCKKTARMDFYFWPMVEYDVKTVSRQIIERYPRFKALGNIVNIKPHKLGALDRIVSLQLVGDNGKTKNIRAEDFRLTVDPTGRKIKSTLCKVSKVDNKFRFYAGRGFGHAVGMCQCGAQAMARSGYNFDQILSYYFPTSNLKVLYSL